MVKVRQIKIFAKNLGNSIKKNQRWLCLALALLFGFALFYCLNSQLKIENYAILLSTYTTALSSIFAIVMAISLLAIQHAASKYSPSILDSYIKSTGTILVLSLYPLSIVYGLVGLVYSLGVTEFSIAGALLTACLYLLWLNFNDVVNFVNPIRLITNLQDQAKRRTELREIENLTENIRRLAIRTLDLGEEEVTSKCIESLESIGEAAPRDKMEIKRFLGFTILYHLAEIGHRAAERRSSILVKKAMNSMEKIADYYEYPLSALPESIYGIFASFRPPDVEVAGYTILTLRVAVQNVIKKHENYGNLIPYLVREMFAVAEKVINSKPENWKLIFRDDYPLSLLNILDEMVRSDDYYDQEMVDIVTPNLIGIAGCMIKNGIDEEIIDAVCQRIKTYNFFIPSAEERLRQLPNHFKEALRLYHEYASEIEEIKRRIYSEVAQLGVQLQD